MDNLHDLAEFYKKDLLESLAYMLKPHNKHMINNLQNVNRNDLLDDRYSQLYDPTDRNKMFKFQFMSQYDGDNRTHSRLIKAFFINGVRHNNQDYPTDITYWLGLDQILLEWFNNGKEHRIDGPARILYNIKRQEILENTWYINGRKISEPMISRWLSQNELPKLIYKLPDAYNTLFKLQVEPLLRQK